MDDLLDLNWTASSSTTTSTGSKPHHGGGGGVAAAGQARSAFSSGSSGSGSSMMMAPNYHQYNGSNGGGSIRRAASPAATPEASASTKDAFSSLFDGSGHGSGSGSGSTGTRPANNTINNLTMQQRIEMQRQQQMGTSGDVLATSPTSKSAAASDPWDFDLLTSATPSPASSSAAAAAASRSLSPVAALSPALTGALSPLGAHTGGSSSYTSTARASSPFDDLADFAGPLPRGHAPSPALPTAATTTSAPESDLDDVLGLLGQPVPVSQIQARRNEAPSSPHIHAPAPRRAGAPTAAAGTPSVPSSSSSSSSRPPSRAVPARTPSPPPHILGQIVMMGFSVQQARLALAATLGADRPGEWSAQAALEVLASDGAANAQRSQERPNPQRVRVGEGEARARDGSAEYRDGDRDEQEQILRPRSRQHTSEREREREQERERERERERQSSSRSNDAQRRDRAQPSRSQAASPDQQQQQQQGDLLAQASLFGSSVFKSANAYWKTSRAQIQKAVEENKFLAAHAASLPGLAAGGASGAAQNGGRRSTTPGSAAQGRPKWMTEDVRDAAQEDLREPSAPRNGKSREAPAFKDEDDDGDDTQQSTRTAVRHGHETASRAPTRRPLPETEINLFSDDGDGVLAAHPSDRHARPHSPATAAAAQVPRDPKAGLRAPEPERRVYASPNRRKPAAAAPQTATPTALKPQRSALPPRVGVAASASALASSQQHRTKGNELFKLGRYGDAVESYTRALDLLPEGHLGRIALLNNRANARLKNGEEKRGAEDAGAVLALVLGRVGTAAALPPAATAPATKEEYQAAMAQLEAWRPASAAEGDAIDAHDALGKALGRRAKAHEGCEKWGLALKDWSMLVEMGEPRVTKSAGGMALISSGLARCRKAADGSVAGAASSGMASGNGQGLPGSAGTASAPASAKPKPRPRPAVARVRPSAGAGGSSAAVSALREGAKRQEAEDTERQQLKDSVDERITAWRGGKETNLRALIASLDAVLWPGAGWQKVGMHELITDGQLKIRYMKAIAKVHPDKISKSASVEERMLADSIFSGLNDAWTAQQK